MERPTAAPQTLAPPGYWTVRGLKPVKSTALVKRTAGSSTSGNLVGALQNWVRLQNQYECYYFIADWHALTTGYANPQAIRESTQDIVLNFLAAGLDPERCTIFIQSRLPEHAELCWLLNCVTPLGELGRMTQFKEKGRQHRDNVNVGLLDYPVLQAADILIYKAGYVPVGEDQIQHVEFSREIARKFNARFGDPEAMNVLSILITDLSDVISHLLDGTLSKANVEFEQKATVCKYLVPQGYPETPVMNAPLDIGKYRDALLYYANVDERDGMLYTQASRTIAFVGVGDTLYDAEILQRMRQDLVTGYVRHRRDIGTPSLLEKRCDHMKELR
jgi:tryptophanyl-tRNA synthetase